MIKKLRIKLVTAAMLSLLVVLAVIFGTVAALNYHQIVSRADAQLEMLKENDGRFPENTDKKVKGFSPEMPFEARYFSVALMQDNTIKSVNTGRIASINARQAAEYAQSVNSGKKTKGFVGNYRFLSYTDETGMTQIRFLSCYRELESFHNFLIYSSCVSVVGLAAVLILLIAASQRIIQPVSESYEKQKRFITDAGHELKTPLTIISADTEVLEMDYGENEWLDDIRIQTSRLADLTNNLVYLARMEEQPQVTYADFSLSDAAKEAADDFQVVAAAKGKTLTAEIEPDLQMCGDEKAIRRLIAIFLDNAVKYTDEQGRISLTLDKWRGNLRLQVYNTTASIDREALPHLFDRFYRTDTSRSSKTGGYGLGLSIAAAIAAAHHGKITAVTEDEKSLLITVIFRG